MTQEKQEARGGKEASLPLAIMLSLLGLVLCSLDCRMQLLDLDLLIGQLLPLLQQLFLQSVHLLCLGSKLSGSTAFKLVTTWRWQRLHTCLL